jgi:hypothetical protein
MRSRFLTGAIFLIITVSAFVALWPAYQTRRNIEKNDRTICISIDFEDVLAAAGNDPAALAQKLIQLTEIPVTVLALSDEAPVEDEMVVRAAGFRVLWQIKTSDYRQLQAVLSRFRAGDGVMSTEKHAPGFPMYVNRVAETVRANNGFLPLFEFLPQKGLAALAKQLPDSLIKAHLIGDREVFSPQPALWKNRLDRAAGERGVRLFYLRLSPSQSWDANLAFLKKSSASFSAAGFQVGPPHPYENWETKGATQNRLRLMIALLLSAATPVLGFWLFATSTKNAPYIRFLSASLLSVWGGVVVYLMGASVPLILGISSVSGVKLQLLVPLVIAGFLITHPSEWKKWFEKTVKVKHVILVGGVIGALGVFYLMRSGNFPLIPVSDSERHFRDALERWLGARPRFKEFFIGHPALITAFYLQRLGAKPRALLLIGLIGQISIVNTFLHFHIPLEQGLLRTFHGLWIGSLLAVPLCWAAGRIGEAKP